MDPLSDYTALSPRENDALLVDRPGDSEDVSTQQCSADPNAFAGLRRPFSVVVPQRSSTTSNGGGGLRLALGMGGSVSQLSQVGANSQTASQFHEVFLEDTQHDEDVATVRTANGQHKQEEKSVEEEEEEDDEDDEIEEEEEKLAEKVQLGHRLRGASTNSGGGFLSLLEQQPWANSSARGDGDSANTKMDIDEDEDEMATASNDEEVDAEEPMHVREETEDDVAVVRGGGFIVEDEDAEDPDATPVREDRSENGARGSEEAFDVDDGDSMGSTQVLDEDLEGEQDLGDDDDDYTMPSTEAFPDTVDQDAVLENEPDGAREPMILATPEDQPTSLPATVASENASSRIPDSANRFLKRKQKARETLRQDERAFVDTEEQTLAEVAARIRQERTVVDTEDQTLMEVTARVRKERAQAEVEVMAAVSQPPKPSKTIWSSQDESQDELPPTQPSKQPPGALKKREKAETAIAQLTDSQERSYEFVDSSCQCGEAVCECSGAAPSPVKPAVRTSSAMRNLEFSFAIPESQDSESQQLDSFPDLGALALKTLQASRLVEKPPPKQVEGPTSTNPSPQKRKNDTPSADEATPKKARQVKASSPSSAPTTPVANRKRGRTFLSPDAGTDEKKPKDVTPKKATRGAKPPIAPSTVAGSVTPSVRTRARILSPIPNESSRAYASRTKSLFKGRFEFCLTGFTGEGQANLAKLIEDYGGRVWERHQDVLQKKPNNKAVVIATSVSWRKLKFMFAVACGIPVVHPEWIHACIKQRQLVPFEGYCVPSGCSVTTGKFECLPVKELDIFRGLKFGIPLDVQPANIDTTKSMSELTAFILRACGADSVQEDLQASREQAVDIVLADEMTKVCEYHARKNQAAVKTFAWVTECMILQRFLEPKEVLFMPQQPKSTDSKARGEVAVMAASAQIGDSEQTTLKLHTGELLLVDLSAEGKIDHFLLFDVCEILSIHVSQVSAESSKRKSSSVPTRSVRLHVGVLERRPNSPELSRRHTRVIDLTPDKVKRRVVAVSKADFDAMLYRDESIFYYEDE